MGYLFAPWWVSIALRLSAPSLDFSRGRILTAQQHEFIDMMIDHLTERGVMEARLLYESPFTDINPLGVAGVFAQSEVVQLIQILDEVRGRAAA